MLKKLLERLYIFLLLHNVKKRGFGHIVSAEGKARMILQVTRANGKKEDPIVIQ